MKTSRRLINAVCMVTVNTGSKEVNIPNLFDDGNFSLVSTLTELLSKSVQNGAIGDPRAQSCSPAHLFGCDSLCSFSSSQVFHNIFSK